MYSLADHTHASLKEPLADHTYVSLKGLLLGRVNITSMELMEEIKDLIGSLFPKDRCFSEALINTSKASFQDFVRGCRRVDNIEDPDSDDIKRRSTSN